MSLKFSKILVVLIMFLNWVLPIFSSVCKPGEEQFAVFDCYNNKVYADGVEITQSRIVIHAISLFTEEVVAFCVPAKTRLIAVRNELQMQGAYLLASIGNKLVTNKEWRCVETMNEEDWYKVKYIDKNWPQAHEKSRGSVVPSLLHKDIYNISRNAMPISASQGSSPKYYCRAWIGHRPSVEEILTRSAFARKTGKHQRLDFHLLKSFLVHDIFDCVTRCLDHEDCVSMNVANSKNSDMLQTCELNRKVKREARGYMLMNKDYDYYDIFRQ